MKAETQQSPPQGDAIFNYNKRILARGESVPNVDKTHRVTTVEQDGSLTGEQAGRVWIFCNHTRGASRTLWFRCDTVAESIAVAAGLALRSGDEIHAFCDQWPYPTAFES